MKKKGRNGQNQKQQQEQLQTKPQKEQRQPQQQQKSQLQQQQQSQLQQQPQLQQQQQQHQQTQQLQPLYIEDPGTTTLTTLGQLKQKLLSREELQTILHICLKGENCEARGYQLFSLSGNTEGFLGVHYILIINYNDKNGPQQKRCFLKLLNGAATVIFQIVLSLNAYNKEQFFYEFLLREFERHDIDVSFAPQGYFCKPYLIVLQDVASRGYRNSPKNEFLNIEHCKIALKTLARFHSTSILYEATQSKELEAPYNLAKVYPEMFKEMIFTRDPNSMAKSWFEFSLQGVLQVADLIPQKGFKKKDFTKKLKAFVDKSMLLFDSLDKFKCTILHGDLWSNNFLFKYENDPTPVDAILIDYQVLKFGPPALDVLNLLFCNTRKEFRDKHFKQLIEYYYTCLRKCLSNIKINDVLPKREYLQLCNDLQCLMKLQCICDRCVTFMPDEYLQECTASGNDEDMRKYLFEGRPAAIVSCFRKKGLFRDLLIEDILELRDMLFKQT